MSQPSSSQWQSVTTSDNSATIAVGQTTSNAVDLQGTSLTGLNIPANFSGTQLTFQVSNDGVNFGNYRNTSNALITITVTPGSAIGIVPSDFASWRYIKFISGTTQATTNAIIGLATRPLA